jgi:hypothetical protein
MKMDLVQASQITFVRPTIQGMLASWIATILGGTVWLKLYQNNVTVSDQTVLSDVQECNFGGYAKAVISSFSSANIDQVGNAWALTPLEVFQCNGVSGNNVYGAYLTGSTGVQATATNAGNVGAYASVFVITAGGSGYQIAPAVLLTGATGSGAAAHAVITGGVVTSIVLDSPGSAYTTYTVVIDPPELLLAISPFGVNIPVSLATDAIPFVQQVGIPSITLTGQQNP